MVTKKLVLAFACFVLCLHAKAQGELPVNMFTGTPTVEVPIYTLTHHDLSEPVRLIYSARGIRLDEPSGPVGVGWSLAAGGSISREVRGLPDNFTGTSSDTRRGWMYTSGGATTVHNMANTADLLTSTCSEEITDFNTINSFAYNADTEPDVFSYSVAGLSGKFVFDKDKVVRLIPYRDIKVEPIYTPSESEIIMSGFTITTNNGITYSFNQQVSVLRWTEKYVGISTVEFLKRNFELYDLARFNAKVGYVSEWKLTSIISPSGAAIGFFYSNAEDIDSRDTIKVAIGNDADQTFTLRNIYINRQQSTRLNLTSIQGLSGPSITFNFSGQLLKTVSVADVRSGSSAPFQHFALDYYLVFSIGTTFTRNFLASVRQYSGCETLPPHKFTYVGVDITTDAGKGGTSVKKTVLPTIWSRSKDIWGYFNGKFNSSLVPKLYVYPALATSERYRLLPIAGYGGPSYEIAGADRTPDGVSAEIGSLQTITWPWGGSTTINYESNQYYDATAAQNFTGGGLRIKSVTYFDGVNSAANVVKNFTYEESTGVSSGRLLSMPAFAIPTFEYRDPANGSNVKSYAALSAGPAQAMWEHLIVRTEEDLSTGEMSQGSSVGYKVVKVARPGSGWAIFDFLMPGVFGEAASGDWDPTLNKFIRNGTCPSMGIVSTGGTWAFPYAPNPSFDHERGLLWKKSEYNQAGTKVRQALNTYQSLFKSGSAPVSVWGAHYDQYPHGSGNTFLYGKYFLSTDVDEVLSTETITTYDDADANKYIADVTEYFHESGYHKLLTRVKRTNSDGSIHTHKTRYPLDYNNVPPGGDKASQMIALLQSGFMNGVPIEELSLVQRSGESEKVAGASVVKFNDFIPLKILPQSRLTLNLSSPTTSFTQSYVDATSKSFTIDTAYEEIETNLAFDDYGKPLSSKGISPIVSSTHWGYNKTLPVVVAIDAAHDQFTFSDFETQTGFEFQQSANVYGTGRTGKKGLYPKVMLSRTIQKAPGAANYVLSFWFKKLSSAIDFNIKVKNTAGTTTYLDSTFTVNPATSNYIYVEKVFSASSYPSAFAVEFQGQITGSMPASDPGLLPLIDDVAFYPENTQLTTYTYSTPFGVSAVTDARGTSAFTTYDKLGRVKYVMDKDKNILQRNTWEFLPVTPTLSAAISAPANPVTETSLIFLVTGNECITGTTYEWDFGTGFSSGSSDAFAVHNYTTAGPKVVTVRVTNGEDELTRSIDINVALKPLEATICAKGVYEYSNCGQGVLTTYSCAAIASTPPVLGTIFRATPEFDDTGFPYTYQWKKRNLNGTTWTNAGTSNQLTAQLGSPYGAYVVKCIITASNGRTGETEEYAVFVTCGAEN